MIRLNKKEETIHEQIRKEEIMSPYMEKAHKVREESDIHYNCAQGVLAAFAEELGIDEDTAFRVGANFGSGMRIGGTCGAVTGALMVLGLAGVDNGPEMQALIRRVRGNHEGVVDCKDLLRLNMETDVPKHEHCDNMVYEMVEMTEEILREKGIIKEDCE